MNLLSLEVVEAPHAAAQGEVREFCRSLFRDAGLDLDRALAVFDGAGIDRRTFALPLAEYGEPIRPARHHGEFRRVATEMLREAARRAVPASLAPRVTHVVTVSTSGVATPTVECELFETLGIAESARRVPVFGLGCAGGVAGLQVARDLAASRPDGLVLLLCVELTSLTLLSEDQTQRNVVACAIFGDGAAAALVASPELEATPPALARIGHGTTRLLPGTHDLMGWSIEDRGWRVVFSPRIPGVVRREVAALVDGVADRSALRHFALHPGGRKVLEAYQEALGLSDIELEPARSALRRHGNMSAASVFFVLDEILSAADVEPGSGIATAFGPGFSAEGLALEVLGGR